MTWRPRVRPVESGFALPLTLLSLALISGMVVASFLVAFWDAQTGLGTLRFVQADAKRSAALEAVLEGLDVRALLDMAVDSTAVRPATGVGGFHGVSLVRRSNSHTFSVLVRDVGGSGIGRLVRIRPRPTVLVRPLSSRGHVRIGARVFLGRGTPAGRFEDCADSTEIPVPPEFDALSYEDRVEFAARADKTIVPPAGSIVPGPSSSGGECLRGLPTNWGDPSALANPCGTYFPIIHWAGDLTVLGGTGQGVLVVDGDLTVSGGFAFEGLILVGGALTVSGSGVRIAGAVQVEDPSAKGSEVIGPARLNYSSCALSRALLSLGKFDRLWQRGWFPDRK